MSFLVVAGALLLLPFRRLNARQGLETFLDVVGAIAAAGALSGVVSMADVLTVDHAWDPDGQLIQRLDWSRELGAQLSLWAAAISLLVGLGGGVGLMVGLVAGLTNSKTWPTTLAWLHLQLSGQVPAVSLISFLEDARQRDILRTVGALYQFRHARLQDQLAAQATGNSPTFSTVSRPS